MRLPLSMLLYAVAFGLFCWAGWTFYQMLPMWKTEVREQASTKGMKEGVDLLARGKGQGAISLDWRYSDADWWGRLKEVNLIGKQPPPKSEDPPPPPPPPPPSVDMRPLDTIIELVSLMHDGIDGGTGGNSHVIVRYKPEANVIPPEWWVRENTPPTASGAPAGPRDIAAARLTQNQQNQRGGNRSFNGTQSGPATTSALPTSPAGASLTGREMLQKLWIADDGDVRHDNRLWPPFENIRLVRVAANAESAFFVRELPPAKPGEAPPEPEEEELLKTTMNLSQDVLREMRRLHGREAAAVTRRETPAPQNTWREVEETTRVGNSFHIGRSDERRFRDGGDDFLAKIYVDTYVGKNKAYSGLQVRNVEPQMASRFGVGAGDVLLEVNGRKVESRAQTINMVKKDYERGVRTFATKWLSNGQVVDRTYQAPDR